MAKVDWLEQFRQTLLVELRWAPELVDAWIARLPFETLSEGFSDRPAEAARRFHGKFHRVRDTLAFERGFSREFGIALVAGTCLALLLAALLLWKLPNHVAGIALFLVLAGMGAVGGLVQLIRARDARRTLKGLGASPKGLAQ